MVADNIKRELSTKIKISYATLCDLSLLSYFCVMFAHQRENTFDTILRYGIFLTIVCVYIPIYPPVGRLKRHQKIHISAFEIWFLFVFLYGAASILWSMDAGNVINVLINLGKTMTVCFLLRPHLNSRKAIKHVLVLLLFALCYMGLIIVIRTPFSAWGTERIGEVINLHSNEIGRLTCLGALISAYFFSSQKKCRLLLATLILLFSLCAFMTGSKNALFILGFQFGIYFFLISEKRKKFLVIIGIIGAGILGYRFVMTNEVLYDLVGNRLERMLSLFTGGTNVDGSTIERLYFMQTAWMLFKQHFLIGIGMNNFSAYLSSIGYINAVYSHSGFLELLATQGLLGFLLYYSLYIKTLKYFIKCKFKDDQLCAVLVAVTLRVFLFDITTISLYTYNSYITLLLAFCMTKCLEREKVCRGNQN